MQFPGNRKYRFSGLVNSMDRIQSIRELWGRKGIFSSTKLELKFSISFSYKCRHQTSVVSTGDFVTDRNHRYLHVTLQFLKISLEIAYWNHYVKTNLELPFELVFFFFLNSTIDFLTFNTIFFYLFYSFMAVLGLRFCARAFSSCGKWGPLFIAVRGASHYRGLSCCGAQAPDAQAQ